MRRISQRLRSLSAWVVQPVLVLAVLIVGFTAASRLSLRRDPPKRSDSIRYAPLVRAVEVVSSSHRIGLRGNGTLEARTRIDLISQVGGEIVAIHPGLRSGGHFRAGEALLAIEAKDYELAISRAEADVARAQTDVVTLKAESEAALAEWERLNPERECPPLVRLVPQLQEADARVLSAEVELENAELDLARTELRLPFDGRVVSASVDIGEIVAANQGLGVVYATDVFEVVVPLRAEQLGWLQLPSLDEPGETSPAVVHGEGIRGPFEVPARIARVFGELDPESRLARVVVEIELSALSREVAAGLVPGTFVDVEFTGKTLEGVSELPRGVLRDDGVVWVVDDDVLGFVRPQVLYRGNGVVLAKGLSPDTFVVTSDLEVVTDGMLVRVEQGGSQ